MLFNRLLFINQTSQMKQSLLLSIILNRSALFYLSFLQYYIVKKKRSAHRLPLIQLDKKPHASHPNLTFPYSNPSSQSFITMSKRQLPPRAARSVPPPHLRQSPSPPQSTRSEPESQQEVARKQAQSKRKMHHMHNLKKYPYTRSLHYFMNLEQLPRSKESISYAHNQQICLPQTFSKDHKIINKTSLAQILNRKVIGLPINTSGRVPMLSQSSSKNVCYGYLFQIQDKKHNNDRIIYTLKLMLKKWPKVERKDLERLDFMRKDADFQEIFQEELDFNEIKKILKKKLDQLQSRKFVNSMNWQFEDSVFFYHALNQKLHNQVTELRYKLSEDYLSHLLFDKQFKQYEFFHKKQPIEEYLAQMTAYYQKAKPSLSKKAMKSIISNKAMLLNKGLDNKFLTNFPVALLYFGRDEIVHSFTEFLLGRKAFCLGEAHFYQVKLMIQRLFGKDLKVKSQKMKSYDLFYKKFRKIHQEIINWKKSCLAKKQSTQTNPDCPLLDDRLNERPNRGKRSNLFRISKPIEISKKEYIFLMTYFWLSQCIDEIYPFLLQFQDLIEVIGSDFYSKVCNILVQVIDSPLAGLIFYIFEDFEKLFSKNESFQDKDIRLYFEFDEQINVGMLWRETIKIEKHRVYSQEEQDFMQMSKKIKTK